MNAFGDRSADVRTARQKLPTATYRLQVRPGFDLFDVAAQVPYLASLGVDTLYLSPLLPSSHGSAHGYDVIAWNGVDPQRGGPQGWEALRTQAASHGLSILIDIVPNHTGIGIPDENAPWSSVLSEGQASPYARWFDIEWLDGKIRWYRRFFAVDSLAGLRVELEDVFDATHETILGWARTEGVVGLRVDHPDGLADPLGYLARLRSLVGDDAWLLIEKILEPGETLPTEWPVDGTTGYDALAEVTAVLVDSSGAATLTGAYRELTGDHLSFHEHVAAGKREVATTILRPEVRRLQRVDPSKSEDEIVDAVVAMPVYRDYSVVDEYAIRFGQVSGAVMAKGVEDTAYYRYSRFAALNEVGGDPGLLDRARSAVEEWHTAQRARQQAAPRSMTTLSTHDTKRGEDIRARLAVLAELPTEWAALARTLMAVAPLPDGPFAYLLWQTFAGAGFIARERMHAYAGKAMREASTSTNWISPNPAFEDAVHAVIERAYDDPAVHTPLAEFVEKITPYGWVNSLSQKLLQLTMPGVPDVYQGTETWEDSLVDPDNRRPVDFGALAAQLGELTEPPPVDASGSAKLWLTAHLLRARRDRSDLFTSYRHLAVRGAATDHALAYDRGGAIAVATRLPAGLERAGGWGDATIEVGRTPLHDVLSGRSYAGEVALADLLSTYPCALLVKTAASS